MFKKYLTLKITEFAKKISVATMSRAVKSGGGKSLKHLKKPLLTSTMVKKRQERQTRLLNDLKSHGNPVISDEKIFTMDPVINKQNNRVVSFSIRISNQASSIRDDAWQCSL